MRTIYPLKTRNLRKIATLSRIKSSVMKSTVAILRRVSVANPHRIENKPAQICNTEKAEKNISRAGGSNRKNTQTAGYAVKHNSNYEMFPIKTKKHV